MKIYKNHGGKTAVIFIVWGPHESKAFMGCDLVIIGYNGICGYDLLE